MTAKGFRRIALGMEGAVESAHMGHPDFRVNGRVFATLGYPDTKWGMVALTPDQQQDYMTADSETFKPANGAWGRQGATIVRLASADEDTLGQAMTLAWQNASRKPPAKKSARK